MNASVLLEKSNFVGMVFLFLWISFFAPFVSEQWRFKFLLLPCVLLIISLCFKKNLYKFIFNKTEIPFFIFLLTMIGGIIAVKEPAVTYWHFWSFIFPIPFLYLFAKAAFKKKYGLLIIKSICFMAALVGIFGIIEFLTTQNFIYTYFAKNMYFEIFKGKRMMSAHIHPVPLGAYLVATLPMPLMLALKEKKIFFRVMYIIVAGIILISIILTFSRGAILGTLFAISMMLIILARRKKIFFLILIGAIAIFFGYWSYAGRLKKVFRNNYASDASLGFYRYSADGLINRFTYSIPRFKMCLAILNDHPFSGVGFGHYRVLFDYYLPDLAKETLRDCKVADSMYMTLLAETGVIGFSGFILFISFLFRKIWNKLKLILESEDRLLLASFLSGFIGILFTFLTYDGLYWIAPSYLFWSFAGILSSLSQSQQLTWKE